MQEEKTETMNHLPFPDHKELNSGENEEEREVGGGGEERNIRQVPRWLVAYLEEVQRVRAFCFPCPAEDT